MPIRYFEILYEFHTRPLYRKGRPVREKLVVAHANEREALAYAKEEIATKLPRHRWQILDWTELRFRAMKRDEPISAYPLCWPDSWKRETNRKAAAFNKRGTSYRNCGGRAQRITERKRLNVNDGVQRVMAQLSRMGISAGDAIISTNLRTGLDGLPRSDQAQPSDPGAAVYWRKDGNPIHYMAIDRYTHVEDNVAAIAATLEAMRAIDRHGGAQIMERAFRGFAALPEHATTPWREVLRIAVNVPIDEDAIKAAFRDAIKGKHPDQGGDREEFERLVTARDAALLEVASKS